MIFARIAPPGNIVYKICILIYSVAPHADTTERMAHAKKALLGEEKPLPGYRA
jgi:hypothetical protein